MSEESKSWNPAIKELGDKIVALSLLQAKELADYLEEVHGIKAAAGGAVMMAAAPAAAAAVDEGPSTKTVVITEIDASKKINIIKVVREITGLGLKEAKDLVEKTPGTVKENIELAEAEALKKKLEAEGAKVELK